MRNPTGRHGGEAAWSPGRHRTRGRLQRLCLARLYQVLLGNLWGWTAILTPSQCSGQTLRETHELLQRMASTLASDSRTHLVLVAQTWPVPQGSGWVWRAMEGESWPCMK